MDLIKTAALYNYIILRAGLRVLVQGGSFIFDQKFECELDVKELSNTSKTPATPSLASNDTTITRKVTNISRFTH